ncbi:MAG: YebC/PmpR family DNA-binding transcriptional regulator [Acetobacteraceae bacterium]|nr:YebC/PmpR family DNA-binding transcriptional regulator [Acetobacteraceae bacterium]
MAGHSQFKNIMHRKGAQDARRARAFGKIIREITVAARSGLPDPAANPRLRAAVTAARQINMPRDTIERAIRKAGGDGGGETYESVRYEGRGPHGIAVIVEALTDNRNRTAGDVRAVFSRHGGELGAANSVAFLFSRLGVVRYPAAAATPDAMLEAAIEAAADNAESTDAGHEITCAPENFLAVRDALEQRFGAAEEAKLDWRPASVVGLDEEQARAVLRFIDALDDLDDVQNVFANFEVSDQVMQLLSA